MKKFDAQFFEKMGYTDVRQLPTGEWAGLMRFIFTWGLCVGLDDCGYRTRFCYETKKEAQDSLAQWNGEGLPPGWWIKEKGEVERINPLREKEFGYPQD